MNGIEQLRRGRVPVFDQLRRKPRPSDLVASLLDRLDEAFRAFR